VPDSRQTGTLSAGQLAAFEAMFRPKTEEQLAAERRELRRWEALNHAVGVMPNYPTKKGVHLLRRALPEVPVLLQVEAHDD
jgi:hypothetical protein